MQFCALIYGIQMQKYHCSDAQLLWFFQRRVRIISRWAQIYIYLRLRIYCSWLIFSSLSLSSTLSNLLDFTTSLQFYHSSSLILMLLLLSCREPMWLLFSIISIILSNFFYRFSFLFFWGMFYFSSRQLQLYFFFFQLWFCMSVQREPSFASDSQIVPFLISQFYLRVDYFRKLEGQQRMELLGVLMRSQLSVSISDISSTLCSCFIFFYTWLVLRSSSSIFYFIWPFKLLKSFRQKRPDLRLSSCMLDFI